MDSVKIPLGFFDFVMILGIIRFHYDSIRNSFISIRILLSCFLFYYDQDQIRICKSRDKPNYIFSNEKYLIGFGKINSLHIEVVSLIDW